MEIPPAVQAFPDNGRKRINGDQYPSLRFDGTGGRSGKGFYPNIPPHPLEEQLGAPSRPVQFLKGRGRQSKVACRKGRVLSRYLTRCM
ncbi:MAG: hypothetical protein OXC72_05025 [Roseovarius sp.]|nr:hypothetical protein [Roseovarius sp.]MCY4291105.1 hypothetical protein [Roseovarius sp.]MCY4316591.1 hypothetical protein [Roseovarius sp.]